MSTIFWSIVSFALTTANLLAAVSAKAPHVDVELMSAQQPISGSGDVKVGANFKIEKDWHLYWRNPGDSGEPIKVVWDLPQGVTAGDIEWPSPKRIPVGPLVNFGYEKDVLIPVTLKIAEGTKLSSLPIRAEFKWLVCQEECIPGKANLDLTLAVGTAAGSKAAAKFAAAEAARPKTMPADWATSATWSDKHATIAVKHGGALTKTEDVFFFPEATGVFMYAEPQAVAWAADTVKVDIRLDENLKDKPSAVTGILKVSDQHYQISAGPAGGATAIGSKANVDTSLLHALALAFLGGIILNCMPCVFPVLSIKAVGLMKQGAAHRKVARQHGLLYAFGVLISFWTLAGTLLALRAGGEQLGWGFQLQSPLTIFGLALLLFLMGLNLAGVFEIRASWVGIGHGLASRQEAIGAFFSGVLATVVATPCTAPFMGTALGYAVSQPAPVAMSVFTSLALGLAFPYVLVSWFPAFGKMLPKPGRWMETMKQVMAFPLFATVIWLMWVLDHQVGANAVATALLACLVAAVAVWTYERWQVRAGTIAAATMLVASVAMGGWLPKTPGGGGREVANQPIGKGWENYSRKSVQEFIDKGQPIFIDFTAAWCVTCKLNESVALGPSMVEDMRSRGIIPIKADWTNDDPEITQALQEFGRDGVPLYVFYGRDSKEAVILPQILTTAIVTDAMDKLKL